MLLFIVVEMSVNKKKKTYNLNENEMYCSKENEMQSMSSIIYWTLIYFPKEKEIFSYIYIYVELIMDQMQDACNNSWPHLPFKKKKTFLTTPSHDQMPQN